MARLVVWSVLFFLLLVRGSEEKKDGPISHVRGDRLDLYLVPHSHCDAGWLISFEEYYQTEVKFILNSVVGELLKKSPKTPKRVFNWAEMGYFNRWWTDANNTMKENVKKLVGEGTLEFIGGGWVQNDEAITSYEAIINQNELGHLWLQNILNTKPKIGWQIDPFGPSSANTHLFSLIGYKGLVTDRIGLIKGKVEKNHVMEFFWDTSYLGVNNNNSFQVKNEGNNTNSTTSLFVHTLDQLLYGFPPTFDFEQPEKISPPITDTNILERAAEFVAIARLRAKEYKTNQILIPIGFDFAYQNASLQYTNYDKLINFINANRLLFNVTVQYSTLSAFFESLEKEEGVKWPVLSEEIDFYPYAEFPDSWWSGFYTSRPTLKKRVRVTDAILDAVDQLLVGKGQITSQEREELFENRGTSGILAHHDAVTGTARGDVVQNYLQMLNQSLFRSEKILHSILNPYQYQQGRQHEQQLLHLSSSFQSQQFEVIWYNPIGQTRNTNVAIPANNCMSVLDLETGDYVSSQLVPALPFSKENEEVQYELQWMSLLPPLGIKRYLISPDSSESCAETQIFSIPLSQSTEESLEDPIYLQNDNLLVTFDSKTGYLQSVYDYVTKTQISLTNQVIQYEADHDGDYTFRPKNSKIAGTPRKMWYGNGSVTSFVSIQYEADYLLHQTFSLVTGSSSFDDKNPFGDGVGYGLQVATTVGPIPGGVEISAQFSSQLQGRFFTNANGLVEMGRDCIPEGTSFSHHAKYFFPSTHWATIHDQIPSHSSSFGVLFDRGHAASCGREGNLEWLVHRRTNTSELPPAGVGEPLDDQDRIVDDSILCVTGDEMSNGYLVRRTLSQLHLQPPIPSFFSASPFPLRNKKEDKFESQKSLKDITSLFSPPNFTSLLNEDLPFNLRMLSLKPNVFNTTETIARFQHMYPPNWEGEWSTISCVNLSSLFSFGKVDSAVVYSLSLLEEGNVWDVEKPLCLSSGQIVTLKLVFSYF